MKVYATMLNESGEVILKEWPSKKAFEANERWCDPKFINVAATNDLEGYEFYTPRQKDKPGIVYTSDQMESHIRLYRKFHELRAKRIDRAHRWKNQ